MPVKVAITEHPALTTPAFASSYLAATDLVVRHPPHRLSSGASSGIAHGRVIFNDPVDTNIKEMTLEHGDHFHVVAHRLLAFVQTSVFAYRASAALRPATSSARAFKLQAFAAPRIQRRLGPSAAQDFASECHRNFTMIPCLRAGGRGDARARYTR